MFSDRSAISSPSQAGGTDGKTSIQRDWLGGIAGGTRIEFVPGAAGGLGDFRRIYKDANGQDAYLDLQPNERVGNYSDSNRDAWRARRNREADTAEARRLAAEQQQRESAQRAIENRNTTRSLDLQGAQITNQGKQIEGVLAQILQQGKNAEGTLALAAQTQKDNVTLEGKKLDQAADFQKDEVAYRNAVLGQQGQALQDQNRIAAAKLMYDDKHFQQQMELDKRNGRRTQVLGALSLIAQSAARL